MNERIGNSAAAENQGARQTGFHDQWASLQKRMRRRAEEDGDVFLPNPIPKGKVDHIFICMEPSLGRWARSRNEADAKVADGFVNFVSSVEDFILHYSARTYLCRGRETYHLTDFSKGAMLTGRAGVGRSERYDRWYDLLNEELALVGKPGARIFAVGKAVADNLRRRSFGKAFTQILHYSGQAARARNAAIRGREPEFEAFRGSVTHDSFVAEARAVLEDYSVAAAFGSETLDRLEVCNLPESRQKLLFAYKLCFEDVIASQLAQG